MKKLVCIFLMCAFCIISLISCGEGTATDLQKKYIAVPDVSELDEATTKALLVGKGLIPKIKYEYNDYIEEGLVVSTSPVIGSLVSEDDIITVIISKGPSFYYLSNAVGYMKNVTGIDAFSWGDNDEEETKGFYTPYVEEGYLYIDMYLKCYSEYTLAFYGNFGTASVNDTFDKTVPIEVIYDSKSVSNIGKITAFSVKIPLSDLGVQKPTNIYVEFDFTVSGERQTFEAGFDLSW